MRREVLKPPSEGLDFFNLFGYQQSIAIRANGLIFLSGMLPVEPNTGERLHGSVTSETERIFENLKLVLESAGSALDKIVQIHAYIYDRIEYDVLNRVYARYLPKLPPSRTVWSVKIDSGFKVEIDAIACA
jgi:2-iminobutanoate/2-iminopropanoate deaminase